MTRKALGALTAGMLAWMLAGAQIALATPKALNGTFDLIGVANLHFDNAICDNTGSSIDVSGTIDLGSAGFRTRISNNAKGTKQVSSDTVADIAVAQDDPQPIPKQPARGGVGGNPWIAFDLTGDYDGSGNPIGAYVLGRCVQGVSFDLIDVLVRVPSFGQAVIRSLECSTAASNLGVGMGSSRRGATGTLYFDNNLNRVVHRDQAAAHFDVTLLDPASFTKGVGRNVTGAGGNPHVYGRFFRPDSDFSDDWTFDGFAFTPGPDGKDDVTGQSAWQSAQTSDPQGGSDDGWLGAEVWAGRCRDLR